MNCNRKFCRILKEFGSVDSHALKSQKFGLLSIEGRVISVLLRENECIVKDIPSMAGISTRAAFDCLKKLNDVGLVVKTRSSKDRRAKCVSLVHDALCEKICRLDVSKPI